MKSDVKKKRKKIRLSRLFRNTQFLLVISLLISLTIWISLSLSDDNETSTTIMNIPVNVSLSEEAIEDGLKIFSGAEQYASVTVTGNRVALGNISSEDIIVSAESAGRINTSAPYSLSLTAIKARTSDNFEITSVSPSEVIIFVDHAGEKKFKIENKLVYNVAQGYHASVSLSDDNVTIQGPDSEISKIASVAIEGNIGGELKENREQEYEIKLYDHSGNLYSNNMLDLSIKHINAVFTVEPEKKVPIKIKYENLPLGLNLDKYITLEPSFIHIAGPQEILDEIDSISTETVDFSSLKNEKTKLELDFEIPKKCTNLSEVSKATATIDFSNMVSKNILATNLTVKNLSNDYIYDITTESLDLVVIGSEDKLNYIENANISCVIDASGVEGTTGSISLPVEVDVNFNSCWVYGSYTANVYVTKK